MKVTIFNANPKVGDQEFDGYIKELKSSLADKEHEAKLIMLRDFQLHECIGCYTCWLKTPGICCFDDGIDEILKAYLAADIVVYASPVIMGFVSALLKRVNDRMLPVVHPFLKLSEDRMAHLMRYDHYPEPVLLLDADSGDESLEFINLVYRNSKRGTFRILSSKLEVEELCHEIINH